MACGFRVLGLQGVEVSFVVLPVEALVFVVLWSVA